MADHEFQPNEKDRPAPAKPEPARPQAQQEQAGAMIPPDHPATAGRKPLFRS